MQQMRFFFFIFFKRTLFTLYKLQFCVTYKEVAKPPP